MEGTIISVYLVKPMLFFSITNLFSDFLHCYCIEFTHFLSTRLGFFFQKESFVVDKEERKDETSPACKEKLSICDAKVVMEKLGMMGWRSTDEEWREEKWMEGVGVLLEEKEVSMDELKEAFYVFDRNEDGFISPAELWSVMRRLGMKEGMRMADCERMISAFDEDGDGRISFLEFKRLLESAM